MKKKIKVLIGKRKLNVGITGVRQINGSYNHYASYNDTLKDNVIKILERIMEVYEVNKINVFNGGALGFDQLVCDALMNKHINKNIKYNLNLVIPFLGQQNKWHSTDKNRYDELMSKVDKVINVDKLLVHSECNDKYIKRNRYIVDHSDVLLACYDPNSKTHGTESTIKYATKKGVRVFMVNVNDIIRENLKHVEVIG